MHGVCWKNFVKHEGCQIRKRIYFYQVRYQASAPSSLQNPAWSDHDSPPSIAILCCACDSLQTLSHTETPNYEIRQSLSLFHEGGALLAIIASVWELPSGL